MFRWEPAFINEHVAGLVGNWVSLLVEAVLTVPMPTSSTICRFVIQPYFVRTDVTLDEELARLVLVQFSIIAPGSVFPVGFDVAEVPFSLP